MRLRERLRRLWDDAQPLAQLERRQHRMERQLQVVTAAIYRRESEPLAFDDVAFDVFSATGEDGILLYIFSRIGMTNRRCVDIGAGGISGSNVANLIVHHGFSALLIDADDNRLQTARDYYDGIDDAALAGPIFRTERVTTENLDTLLEAEGFGGSLDLLAIDIDGIDYWIWDALSVAEPRIVLVEYQDILGPERCWTVPYRADFDVTSFEQNRTHNDYCGASLAAFTKLGRARGYRLVGCNRGGWNAFFVQDDAAREVLPEVTPESCFRYPWNEFGIKERFPLVADLLWEEV